MPLGPLGRPGAARPAEAQGRPGRPRQTFLEILDEGSLNRQAATTSPPPAGPPPKQSKASPSPGGPSPDAGSGVRVLIERTLRSEKKIDALIASAASGKTFSAGELLALQSTVFRYSQTVEVISRAADRLVGAIKQTLGTQV
jgi:hypothetical protein